MSEFTTINKDRLRDLEGALMKSSSGETIGIIIQIPQLQMSNEPGYIILKSDSFMGEGDRFFAIPATSQFVEPNTKGELRLMITKDELSCAKAVQAAKQPHTNIAFDNSIYELLNYQDKNDKQ